MEPLSKNPTLVPFVAKAPKRAKMEPNGTIIKKSPWCQLILSLSKEEPPRRTHYQPLLAIGATLVNKERAVVAALFVNSISSLDFYWVACEVRNWFIADLKIS